VSNADDTLPVSAAQAAALFADLTQLSSLVLAVSGGPDSTALMFLAARWRQALRGGPKLLAVTIDHGLRPESAAEAGVVAALAGRLGIAHRTLRWTGRKPQTGLQEAARNARYRLLRAAAAEAGSEHVLTAHTLDDQAETVLFRLSRGSGLTGLAAMARTTRLDGLLVVRPFLDLPKARLVATLEAEGIRFLDDPSNRDPRFSRPRLRGLMPALASEGLDAGRLALLARRMARAEAALDAATGEALRQVSVAATRPPQNSAGPVPVGFDAAAFARLPAEIALRVLQSTIARIGDEGPPQLGKLEALLDALAAAHPVANGRFRRTLAGAAVTLTGDRLTIERAAPHRRRAAAAAQRSSARSKGAFTKSR